LKPEINGNNNYKEGKEDFDARRDSWKDFCTKGNFSTRMDMETDLFSIKVAANQAVHEEWEDLMSGNEIEKNGEIGKIGEAFSQPARRRRSSNQTAEEKAAWDKKIKNLRNAKARERRAQKKLEIQNQIIV
jgi:hypothetical protein